MNAVTPTQTRSGRRCASVARPGSLAMLLRMVAVLLVMFVVAAAEAADKPAGNITGIYLTTRYPSLTVRAGESTTIDFSLRNFNRPPQQLSLSVPEIAKGWKATVLGGGQPVESAIVAPDSEEQLRLEPPAGTGPGEYRFLVEARGEGTELRLPIAVTIGQELPAKLKLSTNFPSLRGTATTSFKYRVTVANDSGR